MLSVRACPSLLLMATLLVSPAFATRTHRTTKSAHHHRIFRRSRHHVVKGQRGIDPDRAREIQSALIRQHYLTGVPSGQWDAATESAMQKFQADHGWQTKLTPDSRALIMLGLGPNAAPQPTSAAATAPSSPAPPSGANTLASTHVIQN